MTKKTKRTVFEVRWRRPVTKKIRRTWRARGYWVVSITAPRHLAAVKSSHRTKLAAVTSARHRARREPPAQVRVKRKDGRYERKYTYDADPKRSPG